jgi:hypothetical protein
MHTLGLHLQSLSVVVALTIILCALSPAITEHSVIGQTLGSPCGVRGSAEWLSTRASPLDSTVLTVGTQSAKLCYSRPSARGRAVVPDLVEYGKAWRTGANEPTTLHLTSVAEVAGIRLAAGRYVIMTVPGQEQWRIQFNTTEATEPVEMFRSLVAIGLGSANAERLPEPVERFTIRSTNDSAGPAFLVEWGHFRVRIPVTFPP